MRAWVAAMALLGASGAATSGQAQVRLENLLISMGMATEAYGGNFSAITVPQIDSTDSALAGAGDMGASGTLILLAGEDRSMNVDFDAGVRQFVTNGFQLGNYAPRELSANVEGAYRQQLGHGTLTFLSTLASRTIADRPPMPLYLPPGYRSAALRAQYGLHLSPTVLFNARLSGEARDYSAPRVLPALDLLDRSTIALSAGATKTFSGQPESLGRTAMTVYAAYQRHGYPKQGLGVLRTDNALQLGVQWTVDRLDTRGFLFEFQANGARSRSNSRRVEYNAGRVVTEATVDLGELTQLYLYGLWAAKRYINPQDALVPGEEADNAASVAAEVGRLLRSGVRMGIGGGWTRAETNISGAYYQRFSVSFNLTVGVGG